jgi:choline dehydrogenase
VQFDIVIVGAGTAGCAVAAHLARHTDLSIGIVEAGGRYPAWALHAPLAGLRLRPFWSWHHESLPIPGLAGRTVVFPMGRVVGGTSAVNAMVAAAGHPQDYGFLWDGAADDSPGTLHFQHVEQDLEALGVRTESARYQSGFTPAFLSACAEQGLAAVADLDGSMAETCGTFRVFQQRGCRWSAADLLKHGQHGARIRVLRKAAVRRLTFRGRRAVGIETGGARGSGTISARVGVVVAAGTMQTPCILQRSGIGPKGLLESCGLPVIENLQGVGRNLQDHVGVPWVVPSRVPSPGRPNRWVPAAVRFALFRDGVMASNCCEAGCFLGEPGSRPEIEVFTHFQTAKHPNAVEFSTILLHPASRGEVGIDPQNTWGAPRIDPAYFSAAGDLERLAHGLERTIRIANSESLLRFGLHPSRREVDSRWIRANASTYYHPGGSCRLGDDAMAVVNRDLRVHGVEGVWVADNSIVPELPGGHTALTALMIGAHAGRLIATATNA